MKILFICRGNVGRSQMAAALLKKMMPRHDILSAGTKVVGKDGTSRHGILLSATKGAEKVIEALAEEGIDVSHNPRTQLNEKMLEGMDRVIVMSEHEHIPEYLLNHPEMIYWDVKDPKDTDLEFHRKIRDQIKTLLTDNKSLFE